MKNASLDQTTNLANVGFGRVTTTVNDETCMGDVAHPERAGAQGTRIKITWRMGPCEGLPTELDVDSRYMRVRPEDGCITVQAYEHESPLFRLYLTTRVASNWRDPGERRSNDLFDGLPPVHYLSAPGSLT